MKRKKSFRPKGMNPALAAITKQRSDNLLISAAGKAHMIITIMVLHDKFGFGGEKRIPKFVDEYHKMLEAYNSGYVNVSDLEQVLKEECGVEIQI